MRRLAIISRTVTPHHPHIVTHSTSYSVDSSYRTHSIPHTTTHTIPHTVTHSMPHTVTHTIPHTVTHTIHHTVTQAIPHTVILYYYVIVFQNTSFIESPQFAFTLPNTSDSISLSHITQYIYITHHTVISLSHITQYFFITPYKVIRPILITVALHLSSHNYSLQNLTRFFFFLHTPVVVAALPHISFTYSITLQLEH